MTPSFYIGIIKNMYFKIISVYNAMKQKFQITVTRLKLPKTKHRQIHLLTGYDFLVHLRIICRES